MGRPLYNVERSVLEKLLAKPTSNSGARFENGDGIRKIENFTDFAYAGYGVEVKATEKLSRALDIRELNKIKEQVRANNLMPVFATVFIDKNRKEHCYITLELSDFLAVLNE